MKSICLLLILTIPSLAWADVVLDWNKVTLVAIQRTSAPPPIAARALAMTHVAIYDAVNSIEPTHRAFRVYYSESPTHVARGGGSAGGISRARSELSCGTGWSGESTRQQSGGGPGRSGKIGRNSARRKCGRPNNRMAQQ